MKGMGNVASGNFRQGFGQMVQGAGQSLGGAAKGLLSPVGGAIDNAKAVGRGIGNEFRQMNDWSKMSSVKQADDCYDDDCEITDEDLAAVLETMDEDELQELLAEVDASGAAGELGEPELGDDELALMQAAEEGGLDEGGELGGGEDEAIAELIESMSPEELAELAEEVEAAQAASDLGDEPELGEDELDGINILSDDDAVEEYKEAAYHGMTVDELRVAKDAQYKTQLIQEKQARLQAKNAGQARKAQRYGQVIDSLIRR
jgi:hypothetical protein